MDQQDQSQALIARARKGDRQAFDELACRYRERLGSFVRHRLRSPLRGQVEIDDVVQEALLRAYRNVERFQWRDEESFFRWLSGIASNVVFELASRCRRQPAAPLAEDVAASGVSQSKACEREERFERLKASLASLSADHRQVILLARVQRLPLKEVARIMKRTPEAVTQLLWRACRKLRVHFGETESFSLPSRSLAEEGSEGGGDGGGG